MSTHTSVLDVRRIEEKNTDVTNQAVAFVVATHKQETAAIDFIRLIKDLQKEVSDTFDEAIKKAHEAHKAIIAGKKRHSEPLDAAERTLKEKIIIFQNTQERIRQVEETRLNESARKDQCKRIDAAAKRIKTLLEKSGDVAGQISSLENELQVGGLLEEERTAIEQHLNILRVKQDNINQAVAAKLMQAERAQYVAPVPVLPPPPKVQGVSVNIKKKAVVNDLMTLIKAVSAGTVAIGALQANMSVLDGLIKAGAVVPGVSFVEERGLSVRKLSEEK